MKSCGKCIRVCICGIPDRDRWEEGLQHHPKSIELMEFLAEIDFQRYEDYFGWKIGGDGDNGETLMYQMDEFFEKEDR